MYALGIDLGTTFTAAAVWRDGHAEVASLGSRGAAIPSVVLLRDDETVLTGEAASRRGATEPQRVAREFKRRLGDTTPILLGGSPHSAEALMARLLRWTVDEVVQREGGLPAAICVCHPANWGPYKRDLLDQAVRLANIDVPVSFTTEPEAAAVFYARQQRVDPGAVVAVYDLGGGTFDAAVLRKTATGFEILGQPEGIERLGGIDFDAAVFHHVRESLAGKLDELDPEDPTAIAAVARLQEECVAAKEALSSDTDASIPVLLPNLSTEVRITRSEFEAMVRPALHQSIEAMRRALRSAKVEPEQLHAVLLVGGSSRMPMVAQLVGAELGRPVAVDAHPKHAISLGAAWLASGAQPEPADPAPALAGPAPAPAGPARAGAALAGAAVAGAAAPALAASTGSRSTGSASTGSGSTSAGTASTGTAWTGSAAAGRATAPLPALPDADSLAPPPPDGPPRNRRRALLIGALTLVAALAVSGTAVAMTSRGGDEPGGTTPVAGTGATGSPGASAEPETGGDTGSGPEPEDETAPEQESGGPPPPPAPPPPPQLSPDEQCTDQIMSNDRWVCLTAARFENGTLVIEYQAEWAGGSPSTGGGYHLHIYAGDGTSPPDEIMGTHAANRGSWVVEDRSSPLRYDSGHQLLGQVGDHPKVCARIADGNHALVPAAGGGYGTGNCLTIDRS